VLFHQIHQRARFARLLVAASFAVFPPVGLAQNDSALTNLLSFSDARCFAFECNWNLLAAKDGIDAAQAPPHCFQGISRSHGFFSTAELGDREGGTSPTTYAAGLRNLN
jgi:hypothetical protein